MGLFSKPEEQLSEEEAAEVEAHRQRLVRAAGIGSVRLVCHRNTWDYMRLWVFDKECKGSPWLPWVTTGESVKRSDGLVEVPVSGPRVVHLLTATRRVRDTHRDLASSALATRWYAAIASVVDTVDPLAKNPARLNAIVIDDPVETDED